MGDSKIPVVDEIVIERIEHKIEEPVIPQGDSKDD